MRLNLLIILSVVVLAALLILGSVLNRADLDMYWKPPLPEPRYCNESEPNAPQYIPAMTPVPPTGWPFYYAREVNVGGFGRCGDNYYQENQFATKINIVFYFLLAIFPILLLVKFYLSVIRKYFHFR